MTDDVEIDDLPCPACGHHETQLVQDVIEAARKVNRAVGRCFADERELYMALIMLDRHADCRRAANPISPRPE